MPYADRQHQYDRQNQQHREKRASERRELISLGLVALCDGCHQMKRVDHKCPATYMTAAHARDMQAKAAHVLPQALRNDEGTMVACAAGCGKQTLSYLPKNLLFRATCTECILEADHERDKRRSRQAAEAAGREYIDRETRSRISSEKKTELAEWREMKTAERAIRLAAVRQEREIEHEQARELKHLNAVTRRMLKPLAPPPIVIAEFWPYGATGWPYDVVNAAVPQGISETNRADICQELCLMVLAGEIEEDKVAASIRTVARRVYGSWALSLDWTNADGWKLADTLAAPSLDI